MRTRCFGHVSALALLVGSLLTMTAGVAHASPIFPPEVQTHLGLKDTPICTLCHQTLSGGLGTATKPFGVTVRAHGAVAENTSSLDSALDQMAAQNTDSDGDCVPDITELKAGTDPDVSTDNPGACGDGGASDGGTSSSSGTAAPLEPEYGCAVSPGSARGNTRDAATWSLVAALGAFVFLRKSRRRRAPRRGA